MASVASFDTTSRLSGWSEEFDFDDELSTTTSYRRFHINAVRNLGREDASKRRSVSSKNNNLADLSLDRSGKSSKPDVSDKIDSTKREESSRRVSRRVKESKARPGGSLAAGLGGVALVALRAKTLKHRAPSTNVDLTLFESIQSCSNVPPRPKSQKAKKDSQVTGVVGTSGPGDLDKTGDVSSTIGWWNASEIDLTVPIVGTSHSYTSQTRASRRLIGRTTSSGVSDSQTTTVPHDPDTTTRKRSVRRLPLSEKQPNHKSIPSNPNNEDELIISARVRKFQAPASPETQTLDGNTPKPLSCAKTKGGRPLSLLEHSLILQRTISRAKRNSVNAPLIENPANTEETYPTEPDSDNEKNGATDLNADLITQEQLLVEAPPSRKGPTVATTAEADIMPSSALYNIPPVTQTEYFDPNVSDLSSEWPNPKASDIGSEWLEPHASDLRIDLSNLQASDLGSEVSSAQVPFKKGHYGNKQSIWGTMLSRRPPLPAPTEARSVEKQTNVGLNEDSGTDSSRRTDRTHYFIPEDGSPVIITTTRESTGKEFQSSLKIKYYENDHSNRGPGVRVRVTPSLNRSGAGSHDYIKISDTRPDKQPTLRNIPLQASPKRVPKTAVSNTIGDAQLSDNTKKTNARTTAGITSTDAHRRRSGAESPPLSLRVYRTDPNGRQQVTLRRLSPAEAAAEREAAQRRERQVVRPNSESQRKSAVVYGLANKGLKGLRASSSPVVRKEHTSSENKESRHRRRCKRYSSSLDIKLPLEPSSPVSRVAGMERMLR